MNEHLNQIELAINWNHLEVVKEKLSHIKTYMSDDKYKEEFKYLLEIALIGKNSEFVNLLLSSLIENNIYTSFLKEFLDIERLMKLYKNKALINLDNYKDFDQKI